MHIVLMILKVIGIILLVLLGILLLLLLLMLFVPLRYRLHVRKEQDILEADGRMTWLLHLLRIDMTIQDMHGTAVLRVCGFKLKTFRFLKKDDVTETASQKNGSNIDRKDSQEYEPGTGQTDTGSIQKAETEQKSESEEPLKIEEKTDSSAGGSFDEDRNEPDRKNKRKNREIPEEEHPGFIGRILNLAVRILNKGLNLLLQVPGLPAEIHDKSDILQEKLHAKYTWLKKKVDPFLSIEAEHMLPKIIRYAKYLMRGYAPRKITGYLHFGTGAPDLTGILVGLVYVLLPESGTEYNVDPDFYEPVIETDTTMTGQIRSYRLVWVSIRLLLDKEFRILFARIRGKEKVKRHRGVRRARRKAMLEITDKAA